ncbi:zf-RING_2 domain-containing protein [Cephalotus follicularis]|uniref:RING-type E3 ubiquitin transferase n=1 Tax=Cephalotus follicularis TaxID=3775 RepID=A0A1Q3B581_CEPFO|nr:zf-RING_2 domain-containing protein [Cephalotus follicularis]
MMRRQRRDDEHRSQSIPNGHFATGVEEKILNSIPIMYYKSKEENLFRVDQSECVICLGELEDGEMVRLLPNCAHAFHVPCIDEWFLAHTSCPFCRSPIVAAPIDSAISLPIGDESETNIVQNPPDQLHSQGGVDDVNASTSHVQSSGLLRHSVSEVEWKPPRHLITGLKRSLSMDQSDVLVDIQREIEKSPSVSSSKGGVMESRFCRARSMRQLDQVSSKLLSTFSQMRIGRISNAANEYLPR